MLLLPPSVHEAPELCRHALVPEARALRPGSEAVKALVKLCRADHGFFNISDVYNPNYNVFICWIILSDYLLPLFLIHVGRMASFSAVKEGKTGYWRERESFNEDFNKEYVQQVFSRWKYEGNEKITNNKTWCIVVLWQNHLNFRFKTFETDVISLLFRRYGNTRLMHTVVSTSLRGHTVFLGDAHAGRRGPVGCFGF